MKVFISVILIFFFFFEKVYSGCPKMQAAYKYSVNEKKFRSYYEAKSYLRNLKRMEEGWKTLEISKVSPYRYETKWIYDTSDHGLFCVCPDCRLPKMAKINKKKTISER